jgi:hydrogenase-4 component B
MLPIGTALFEPGAGGAAIAAVLVFATHHAFAKAALFLGIAVAKPASSLAARIVVTGALAYRALDLVGAPLTGGAVAKLAVKDTLALHPDGKVLALALSAAAIGSTLLLARYLWLVVPRRASGIGTALPEMGSDPVRSGIGTEQPETGAVPVPASDAPAGGLAIGLALPWLTLLAIDLVGFARTADPGVLAAAWWSATWPVLGGMAIAVAAWSLGRRGARLPQPPAGDVLVMMLWGFRLVRSIVASLRATLDRHAATLHGAVRRAGSRERLARLADWLDRGDAALLRFGVMGLAFTLVAFAILFCAL